MTKVFIDGKVGTTGLRIYQRLQVRDDIELITLSETERKEVSARKKALNTCDVAFLCLPDSAAVESVSLVENPDVVILDTSTAHRTDPEWAYGFPELSEQHYNRIKNSKRIAVPGCHASGFIALVYPLIANGLVSDKVRLTCHSLTGYSGGGKNMIAEYEAEDRSILLDAPRQYGLSQNHKHLKEMVSMTKLKNTPVFCPIVAPYYSGMEVTVPLFAEDLQAGKTVEDIKKLYQDTYKSDIVRYFENTDENGFLTANALSGKDRMEITVEGNEDRILLVARYDNLGKGASGAAVECMNIVLGFNENTGLEI